MKRIVLIITGSWIIAKTFSQSVVGITGMNDTSYTTYSVWFSAKEIYADTKILEEFLNTFNSYTAKISGIRLRVMQDCRYRLV